ncbi:MAG TPA: carbamoyltransferase HypF [Thermoanaerobaculia bacterium]|nr:carbamoyltransferase HypF [Thermoanaerobaculia bacterium]
MPIQGRHIEIRGVVQGVGFRPFVYQLARRTGVTGRVRNDSTGVVIDAFASHDVLDAFIQRLSSEAPRAAVVRDVDWTAIPFEDTPAFVITPSASSEERHVSIPPDLATCNDCLSELFDPQDRRYLYPFTNCTNCGPRYSIVRDIPYDRPKTTMGRFEMCHDCRREYDDPADRRFHAQPNACPVCGPRLLALTPQGGIIATDAPVRFAARAMRAQLIVAVKGIGGFHVACNATSSTAVQRLRDRKHRDVKPLAVMVRDLESAEAIAELSGAERALLQSVERPIVLARRKASTPIVAEVCGENPLIGLLLPYTPLHHILLRETGFPIVLTSGNVADEPMVSDNREALAQLGAIADVFLVHDREIETRVDDSVTRVIAGAPAVFRRGRGYVPRGVEVAEKFVEPVLAVGAHLKNAICIGNDGKAYLGPHIGDLETVATLEAFEAAIEQMKTFIGVEPKVIAHDLHPDYFSTRYAIARQNVALVGVQHHHAHVVSAMAEHHLTGDVLGFAYDGTGYGPDGTSWGGELLIANERSFERVATFRAIPLAGGDQAIRQVWRIALALLDEAFEGKPPLEAIPLFRDMPRQPIESVRRMIEGNVNAPKAHGLGRYFDALGAIGLGMPVARYEGEVAFRWNMAADDDERGRYPVVIRDGAHPWEIDLRPLMRAAVVDLIDGVSPATISARFHNTIAETSIEVGRGVLALRGDMPVVISGGCFQNARLAESMIDGLGRVYINREIPPGDGGVALGQAVIANALTKESTCVSEFQEKSLTSTET